MVTVNLEDFVRTGQFGPIVFGMSRAKLQALLGPPTGQAPLIRGRVWFWRYGDVQFDWDLADDDRLYGIHITPEVADPVGTPFLTLDPWVIRLGLKRRDFKRHLVECGLPHWVVNEGPDFGFVRLGVGVGVRVTFNEGEADTTCPAGLLGVEYSPLYPGPPNC